ATRDPLQLRQGRQVVVQRLRFVHPRLLQQQPGVRDLQLCSESGGETELGQLQGSPRLLDRRPSRLDLRARGLELAERRLELYLEALPELVSLQLDLKKFGVRLLDLTRGPEAGEHRDRDLETDS